MQSLNIIILTNFYPSIGQKGEKVTIENPIM